MVMCRLQDRNVQAGKNAPNMGEGGFWSVTTLVTLHVSLCYGSDAQRNTARNLVTIGYPVLPGTKPVWAALQLCSNRAVSGAGDSRDNNYFPFPAP